MSKRHLLKPSSIVIALLFWIFAIANARHIITAEDEQQVQHHKNYIAHQDNAHHHRRPVLEAPHSPVDHMEKRAMPMREDSFDDSIRSNDVNDGYDDEYPIVTPKRAAMLLDRIMVALHHALEDSEDGKGRKINDVYREGRYLGGGGGGVAATKAHGKTLYHAASAGKSAMRPYGGHKVQPLSDDDIIDDEYDDITEKILDDRSVAGDDAEDLEARDNTMDLQRRGHDASTGSGANGVGKGRVYWRCYFNAVTCF